MNNEALAVFNTSGETLTVVGKIPESDEEKQAMANAMGSATNKLSDYINMPLEIVNYYIERLRMVDPDTGEVTNPLRTVLVDANGVSYQCVSSGVATSLKAIITMYGPADVWKTPLTVTPKSTKRGKGSMLSLKVGKD